MDIYLSYALRNMIRTDIINLENMDSPKYHLVLGTKMAHYKTHIGGWIHHQATLYGHTYILCTANFITSVTDCGRNCVIKEWNPKNTMFVIVVPFMRSEGDTIASLNKDLARYAR